MIPKLMHQIWVGPKPRPRDMDVWREKHEALGWTYKLWTEADLRDQVTHVADCINRHLNDDPDAGYKPVGCLCPRTRMLEPQHRALFEAFAGIYHAQADILRYAVLHQFGGVYLDADTECVQPLDDRFLNVDEGVWSVQEHDNSPLLACGFMGATPHHPLLAAVLNELLLLDVFAIKNETREELHGAAWVLTGPACLSEVVKASGIPIYAWPSYYFIPEHHDGTKYEGDGTVFGRHWWGTTFKRYTAGA